VACPITRHKHHSTLLAYGKDNFVMGKSQILISCLKQLLTFTWNFRWNTYRICIVLYQDVLYQIQGTGYEVLKVRSVWYLFEIHVYFTQRATTFT